MDSNLSSDTEIVLKASRRGLVLVLMIIMVLGVTLLAAAISPESSISKWPMRAPWLLPVAIVIAVAAQRSWMGGRTWNPKAPEVEAVMNDEFRRMNMDRARSISLVVTLIAQVPMALAIITVHSAHAALAMAGATITLAMATLIITFLFLDRA
jgi:hypothetical protein